MIDEALKIVWIVVVALAAVSGAFFAFKFVLRRDNSALKNKLKAGDNVTQVVVGGDFKGDIHGK